MSTSCFKGLNKNNIRFTFTFIAVGQRDRTQNSEPSIYTKSAPTSFMQGPKTGPTGSIDFQEISFWLVLMEILNN